MTHPLTSVTGDAGVNGVGLLVNTQLGWYFRPQPVADVGVDAQVEPVMDGVGSGRLLGLQVKSGPSMFSEPTSGRDGWVYREGSLTHRDYWLRYQLPVLLVLYDVEAHTAYWQQITEQTAIVTGAGFKVIVPASQRLDAAAGPALAALARRPPVDSFLGALDGLPGACATRLIALRDLSPALAQRLAAELLAGRDDPNAAVEKLIDSGTDRWPSLAWASLGDYANEYDCAELAADCFLHAENVPGGADPAGRHRAFAGLLLTGHDAARSRAVLTEASSTPGGALLAAVGLAWLDHGDAPGPVPISQLLNQDHGEADREPTIQRFLAEQRLRAGDLDAAIRLHKKALALVPDAPGQQLALAEALLRRSRPSVGGSHLAECRMAANLAAAARAARRRWRADSISAAEILLQALTLGGDERAAIRVATPAPDGEATDREAASPELAFYAARLSYEAGDLVNGDRFAAVVTASGQQAWITQCAAVRAEACGATPEERVRHWLDVIAAGVPDGPRMVALQHLARLGCWPLSDLDAMRDRGCLAEGMYDLMHAEALAATGDTDRAMALLRGGHTRSMVVAEAYARLLAALGHIDDCLRVCDATSIRFGDPRLNLYALDVLTRADRIDEVITRATALLARADLPFNLRHHVRGKLTNIFSDRRDWISCQRLGHEGLAEVQQLHRDLAAGRVDPLTFPASAANELAEYERDYAWAIIISQYHQGAVDEAISALQALHPDPDTPPRIRVWCDLHRVHGWTPVTAEEALTLAEHDDTPSDVIGRLLFSLLQCCQVSPGDVTTDTEAAARPVSALGVAVTAEFHARLTRAWADFVDSRPSAVRPLSGDDDQVLAQLHHLMAPRAALTRRAHAAVHAGQLPLGALCLAGERPYLLGLLDPADGIIPAADPSAEAHEAELQAAQAALGATISIETSALYVVAALAQLWPTVRGAFLNLLLAEPAVNDLLVSHVAARSTANVVGGLNIHSPTGPLHIAELTDQLRLQFLDRSTRVHAAAQECRSTTVNDLTNLGTEQPIAAAGAWLAPVALALRDNIPLYSDDVVLRSLARGKGIPTFGTLALIEVLLERGWDLPDPVKEIIGRLFHGGVVDIPSVWPLVAQAAEADGPTTTPVLLNLARPALWRDLDQAGVVDLIVAVARPAVDDPSGLEVVTAAMADGLTAALEPPQQVLTLLAAAVLAEAAGVSVHAAGPVLRVIERVAARYDVDPIPDLRRHLLNMLTDPAGSIRLSADAAERTVDQLLVAPNDLL